MVNYDVDLNILDINNIKNINLGLVCIKSNYYNEKNTLDFDCIIHVLLNIRMVKLNILN